MTRDFEWLRELVRKTRRQLRKASAERQKSGHECPACSGPGTKHDETCESAILSAALFEAIERSDPSPTLSVDVAKAAEVIDNADPDGGYRNPFVCPVCLGRRTVPGNFYSGGSLGVVSTATVKCETCSGTGIVWN